jgi:hypothetical protein
VRHIKSLLAAESICVSTNCVQQALLAVDPDGAVERQKKFKGTLFDISFCFMPFSFIICLLFYRQN